MISLLLAMDRNRRIGANNELPWRLPSDLAYFKKLTMGHPILMGRKTYESIGKPLPGRKNIVLTRHKKEVELSLEDTSSSTDFVNKVEVRNALIETLNEFGTDQELFVIGGAEIFGLALPFADRIYLTLIDHEFSGDTYFPEINREEWELTSKTQGIKNDKNPYDYSFIVYDRRH